MIKPNRPSDSSSIRTFAILITVIAVLYFAREILVPLAFAITLALALTPAVRWLQKCHLSRVPAVMLVMVVSIGAAGGVGWVIFNQLVEAIAELPLYRQNIHNKLEAMRTPGKGAFGRATESVKELGKELSGAAPPVTTPVPAESGRRNPQATAGHPLPVQIIGEPASEFQSIRDLVQPFLRPLGVAGIVLIFTLFLMIKQDDLRNRLFHLVGLNKLNVMTQALDDATSRVGRYLLMQFFVNACFGVVSGTGLYLIGVPYAALCGTVAGILRIVPYVGAVVSALLPFTLALAISDGWTAPLLVFLLFALLEMVTGNFLEPWLYGAHTGISALALLLTTVFWAVLWGPAGLILSTPLTVCVVVLGRYVPQFSFLHVILGDEAVLAPEAHVYQRLLAMDDQEARTVADNYLSENNLTQLYDSVIVPALATAEQDRHKGALDPVREEFVFMSIKEMLVEFAEKTRPADVSELRRNTFPGRVLIVPANDEADEITAAMLAQLLEQAGCAAISFSRDTPLQATLELMDPSEQDTFCVSALPPFAFSSAIALSRKLRPRFPKTKIVIGVWGYGGDAERAMQRFHLSASDKLVTSMADAVQLVAGAGPLAAAEASAASDDQNTIRSAN